MSELLIDFYGIGKESYEVLSLADGKFWPFLRMGVFRNAKAIPTANDWKLSDGSDINDYPFKLQSVLMKITPKRNILCVFWTKTEKEFLI